ncbi:MAG: VCBS repeat-containing protein [Acidobacteria bacterium]|nr:VCBS repeat-containing protein [Acidobacteriota bacterium]
MPGSRPVGALLLLLCLLPGDGCARKGTGPADESLVPAPEALPGHDGRAVPAELDYQLERLDPMVEGWSTEAANSEVGKRLKELGQLLASQGTLDPAAAPTWVDPAFVAASLRPTGLSATASRAANEATDKGDPSFRRFEGPSVKVVRDRDPSPPGGAKGAEGFVAAVEELRSPFSDPTHVHAHAKVIHVDIAGDEVTTEVLWEADGPSARGLLQQNAEWTLRWHHAGEGEPLRLREIAVDSYEEVTGPADGEPLFEDLTAAVLGDEPVFAAQLLPGQAQWGAGLDRALGVDLLGHHGLALGDADGDGREDLYVPQQGGLPNRLLLQQPDGTLRDASKAAAVDYLDRTTSALFADFDNDGDQDLVVAAGSLLFHANDGHGGFEVRSVFPTYQVMSLTAADYDGDGDLDLYVCRYSPPEESAPAPYHDANNGLPNVLLRNDGDLRFTDVTVDSGIDQNNRRYSFAAAWGDYDDDGDPDLYVANDFGRNNLYRNDGGRFTDVAGQAGVEDISAGMSADWGDYDGDGHLDLYVGNMFSSAGNRIAYQRRFHDEVGEEVRSLYRRHARGNSLFRNVGGRFEDVSVDAGVTMARWAWSSQFTDFDNDGRKDLFVANGYVTNDDYDDL